MLFKHYQKKGLLDSPKKTNRSKRLYIRNKKIPKWAENLNNVSEQVMQQKKVNPRNLFGVFYVENLNSNAVLSLNENYKRTSSAKWNCNKMFVE